MTGPTYASAGVSLAAAEGAVGRLRAAAESPGAAGFGPFAGLHPLGDGRLLAASTDGVGTKLVLARQRGRLRDCGADLAAHCIHDVITTAPAARPASTAWSRPAPHRSCCSTTSPPARSGSRRWPSSSKAQPRCAV